MGHTVTLAKGDTKHDHDPVALGVVNAKGFLVDPPRTLTHPTLGILTYEDPVSGEHMNPDVTRNFVLAPAQKVDTTIQRTLGSSLVVQSLQFNEDVIISEIWTGSSSKLSILAELFRSFYSFWLEVPAVGEFLTWQPADLTVESYGVLMVNVALGGVDLEYREHREELATRDGAYLSQTLTVQFKIVEESIAPAGAATLVGL